MSTPSIGVFLFEGSLTQIRKSFIAAYHLIFSSVTDGTIVHKIERKAENGKNYDTETHKRIGGGFTDDVSLAHVPLV